MGIMDKVKHLNPKRSVPRTQNFRDSIRNTGILMVLPAVILFVYLRLVPSFHALYLSFTDYTMMKTPNWVGFENYINLFTDKEFFTAVNHTVIYMVFTVFISAALALIFAILLNKKIRLLGLFRTAYYIPQVASWVAISMIWIYIFNPTFGIANFYLSLLHLPKFGWLNDPNLVMPSIIMVSIWRNVGYDIVIYLAGLQGVPTSLYEAARVDGANSWQVFWKITWPLLLPTTMLIIILTSIFALQVFDLVYVLTYGGPGTLSTTIVFYIYQNAFQYYKMGYSSSIAFVLFIIIFIMSLVSLRISSKVEVD
jgi:multiple sugar transport system permease protein